MQKRKLGSAIALSCLLTVGGLSALPILVVGVGGASPDCGRLDEHGSDGTPSILGTSTLDVADLRAWWRSSGRGQPPRLGTAIDDLIALYLSEGTAEGVRGDLALAQAVLETGYFTSADTAINNYAGIGHFDGEASGSGFRDPLVGVRAHIQLLKKFAIGNDTSLAHDDVAPEAGASAATWGALAGTWASAGNYWSSLSAVYDSMLGDTAVRGSDASPGESPTCRSGDLVVSGDYALPLDRHWYDEHPEWFTLPHHDYPAIDIPVPVGTPVYAVTKGVVVSVPGSGDCGVGVVVNGDDRAQYTYCHGAPGTQTVAVGDDVRPGAHLMDSASTGNSTGPHVHLSIEADGAYRCPQSLLVGIVETKPIAPQNLPTSGCTS